MLVRLGPGPTLLGMPDTGLDDTTFERFVRETFSAGDGTEHSRDWGRRNRIGLRVRSRYVAGVGRMPWLIVAVAVDRGALWRAGRGSASGGTGSNAGGGHARPG